MWLDIRATKTMPLSVWSICSDVILKDRPDEGSKAKVEVKPLNHLATYPEIPVPKFYTTRSIAMADTLL